MPAGLSGDRDPVSSAALRPGLSPEFAVTRPVRTPSRAWTSSRCPVLPATTAASSVLGPGAAEVGELLGVDLLAVLEAARATGKAGEVTALPVPLGASDERRRCAWCCWSASAGRRPTTSGGPAPRWRARVRDRAAVATTIPAIDAEVGLEPFVVGAMLGSFGFDWRSAAPEHVPAARIVLAGLADDRPPAPWRARSPSAGPAGGPGRSLRCPPTSRTPPGSPSRRRRWPPRPGSRSRSGTRSGSRPRASAASSASARPRRRRRGWSGSTTRPREGRAPHADRGPGRQGHHLRHRRPLDQARRGDGQHEARHDRRGRRHRDLAALADVGCPVRVVGLVPTAENAVSGNALRPGDVIRHYGGRTTEVTNTDAEGRLVLADAMAYAVAHLEPDVIVDVATLTGAMKVALGQQVGGLFANDDGAGRRAPRGRRRRRRAAVAVPARPAYEEKLSSRVADADNAAGGPGAIIAALFLQHFAGDVPWAHLDIASAGDSPAESYEWTPGPTGFGARALLEWLGCAGPAGRVAREQGERTDRPLVARGRARRASRRSWRRTSRTPRTPGSPAWPGCASRPGGACPGSGSRAATSSRRRGTRRRVPGDLHRRAAEAPGSQIVGSPPILIEECEIVAVAEGWDGFEPRPARRERQAATRLRGPLLLRDQQAVADGQQHRHQAVVVGDLAAELADRHRLLVALGRVGDPVVPQRVVEGHDAAGTQQPQRLLEVGGVLGLVAVAEDEVVVAVGQPRQHLERRAGDGAGALGGMPASVKVSRASRWCSVSMSTVVRMPSARMPRSSHSPETPVPVPISTTARASRTEARKRSAAPPPEPIGTTPTSCGAGARRGQDVVLGDEVLGVGPARGC